MPRPKKDRNPREAGWSADRDREGSSSRHGDLDAVRQRLALMEEFLAWRRLAERSRVEDENATAEVERPEPESSEPEEDVEIDWMRRAQRALVSHPVATQAAFGALAREGRSFASTEDGRAWARILENAPAVQRLRTLWEAANFTITADEGEAPLPSAMIELFVRAAASGDVDDVAARLGMPFLESFSTVELERPREDSK